MESSASLLASAVSRPPVQSTWGPALGTESGPDVSAPSWRGLPRSSALGLRGVQTTSGGLRSRTPTATHDSPLGTRVDRPRSTGGGCPQCTRRDRGTATTPRRALSGLTAVVRRPAIASWRCGSAAAALLLSRTRRLSSAGTGPRRRGDRLERTGRIVTAAGLPRGHPRGRQLGDELRQGLASPQPSPCWSTPRSCALRSCRR